MDRMDRKWTEMDSHIQEGYDALEPDFFYRNGQKWTVIFRRGTMQSTPKKMDRNGQKWTARTPPENCHEIQELILTSTGHVNLEQVHLLRHN